jgi:hypothetical protein
VSSAGTPRSFDAPRPRSVPSSFHALNHLGEEISCALRGPTLIVVVKDQCTGCEEFIEARGIIPIELVIITESPAASKKYQVLLAPAFITELDARLAPVYLLIDGSPLRVLTEGTVFSAEQVVGEIAPFLNS